MILILLLILRKIMIKIRSMSMIRAERGLHFQTAPPKIPLQ